MTIADPNIQQASMPGGSTETAFAGYQAIRRGAGLIHHDGIGLTFVGGQDAAAVIATLTSRNVDFLLDGQSQQSLVLRDDGTVVADVVVYGVAGGYLLQVPDFGRSEVTDLLTRDTANASVEVVDQTDERAVIAVEGPTSYRLIGPLLDFPISSLSYQASSPGSWQGREVLVTRTGVTGEYGYTVMIATDAAQAFIDDLLAAGAVAVNSTDLGMAMMEMRFPRLSHEIDRVPRTPFELGLQWMVDFQSEARGVASLRAPQTSPRPVCWSGPVGCADVPAPGTVVRAADAELGEVLHAVWSPGLGQVIGTAAVSPECSVPGLQLRIGDLQVVTVSAPFLVATSFRTPME